MPICSPPCQAAAISPPYLIEELRMNDHILSAIERLKKSYFGHLLRDRDKARGYAMSNVPVADLVDVVRYADETVAGIPHIACDEEGHVTFEWWHGARKITVYPTRGVLLKVADLSDPIEDVPLTDWKAVQLAFNWLREG